MGEREFLSLHLYTVTTSILEGQICIRVYIYRHACHELLISLHFTRALVKGHLHDDATHRHMKTHTHTYMQMHTHTHTHTHTRTYTQEPVPADKADDAFVVLCAT